MIVKTLREPEQINDEFAVKAQLKFKDEFQKILVYDLLSADDKIFAADRYSFYEGENANLPFEYSGEEIV